MASCNYWVFREGRSAVDGEVLHRGLVDALRQAFDSNPPGGGASESDALLDALLRSGELETALTDAGTEDVVSAAAITDCVAAALLRVGNAEFGSGSFAHSAAQLRVPQRLNISTPEGFAYYALHPLSFAELTDTLDFGGRTVAVIGIRSIGTTLASIVMAACARRNIPARRISVRPTGHPYDRRTEFSAAQLRWLAVHRAQNAEFLVVDEGPGLSGSSLLSVGDALLEAGVERRRIRFLCSRQPDPDTLAAPEAAERWRSFQAHHISADIPHVPQQARIYCGGGEWRRWLYADEHEWPASWSQMERLKFLSSDRKRLFKFTGYGRFGAALNDRARLLAQAGIGPQFSAVADGFTEYEVLDGRPATTGDLTHAVIDRLADYCALRSVEFRVRHTQSRVQEMARFNFEELTGTPAPDWLALEESIPVVCDARMQPHEWIVMPSGTLVKTDGTSHGDDHFFPGPCDIAWDLAGAIVEWELNDDATDALLRRYEQRSGDNVRRRLSAYRVAYSAFRAAYCSMAEFALRGTAEAERLSRAAQFYLPAITRVMPKFKDPAPASAPEFSARLCLDTGT